MIFPGEVDFKNKKLDLSQIFDVFLTPVWILIFCNVFIFIFQFSIHQNQKTMDLEWNKIDSGSAISESFIRQLQNMYLQTIDPLQKNDIQSQFKLDPFLFIKDENFWSKAEKINFVGDQIMISESKKILKKIQTENSQSRSVVYGLGSKNNTIISWITYQFTHANFFHLLSNLFFLYLTVSLLQIMVGEMTILLIYILSGFAAGFAYLYLGSDLNFSVVGASGSIAGLMSFLVVLKGAENIKWSYFLVHKHGHFYMPAFYIFPIFMMNDFIDLLKNSTVQASVGTVAVNAHVGGALFGLISGLIYRIYKRTIK